MNHSAIPVLLTLACLQGAAAHAEPAATCAAVAAAPAPAAPVSVADDDSQPLNVSDPFFAEKIAGRYQRWFAREAALKVATRVAAAPAAADSR